MVFCFQVNLEYLGRVVFNTDGLLYPDSVVGTDSHTTMINGLGVVGWGKLVIHTCTWTQTWGEVSFVCVISQVWEVLRLRQ